MNVDNRGEKISKTNCIFFVIIIKKKVHNLLYFIAVMILVTSWNIMEIKINTLGMSFHCNYDGKTIVPPFSCLTNNENLQGG